MRTRSTRSQPSLTVLLGGLFGLSCTVFAPPTRVIVLHTTSADSSLHEEGKNLNIDHWQIDGAPAGLEKGFFVVKSDLEWHQHWPNLETGKVPVLPADLNFANEMLLVVAPPDRDVTATEVRSVVVNEGAVHAYVNETVPGVDCPAADKDAKANYDLARVPLVDGKDVQFHVESSPADACGSAPQAKVTCRAEGTGGHEKAAFQEKLSADPGTKVTCIVGAFTSPRPVIDLTWTFSSLPAGATSKMIVGSRGTAVSFTPDVFGQYGLQVEVLDDLQRRGVSTTEVDVAPKEPLVMQMIWTKFDPDDDPSTFPRIQLVARDLNADGSVVGSSMPIVARPPPKLGGKVDVPPLPGTPGAPPIGWSRAPGCSVESTAAFCKAKPMGFTTIMSLDPSAAKLYAIGVHFTDDRVQGQAVPCVRSYRAGKLIEDLCDANARRADSWWQVGVFDPGTAKTVQTLEIERAQAEFKAAADARAAAATKAAAEFKAAAEAKAAADARAVAASKAVPAAASAVAPVAPAPSAAPAPKK